MTLHMVPPRRLLLCLNYSKWLLFFGRRTGLSVRRPIQPSSLSASPYHGTGELECVGGAGLGCRPSCSTPFGIVASRPSLSSHICMPGLSTSIFVIWWICICYSFVQDFSFVIGLKRQTLIPAISCLSFLKSRIHILMCWEVLLCFYCS
ncbi:uncharacterized protein LOC125539395 [Triticum urartu]|uniref:uncharacterized protein LOC125539395 n=1 Tax=Triticum urartu TaxID=4572 RepID=UPI002043129A|nr:uncharacterized protein LOC125539395 [Triticum urartu]